MGFLNLTPKRENLSSSLVAKTGSFRGNNSNFVVIVSIKGDTAESRKKSHGKRTFW
jgi:hypothetical protein